MLLCQLQFRLPEDREWGMSKISKFTLPFWFIFLAYIIISGTTTLCGPWPSSESPAIPLCSVLHSFNSLLTIRMSCQTQSSHLKCLPFRFNSVSPAVAFSDFVTIVFFTDWVVSPMPTSSNPGRTMFSVRVVSLS